MNSYDTCDIVRQAREMRAKEMRRIQGLAAARLALHVRQFARDTGEALHSLFSWNRQAH